MSATWRIIEGDALERLRELPAESVRTCVTSPPYFGLRDYGVVGQLGLEATPDQYVAALVDVMGEVRRVLHDDGTLWLNLGDSYSRSAGPRKGNFGRAASGLIPPDGRDGRSFPDGIKEKDLLGIPWMAAFALRAAGWYLRSDIIWAKTNPMPESVTDRPTKAHEYLFLLSKSARYFYDADAIKEEPVGQNAHDLTGSGYAPPGQRPSAGNRRAFRGGGAYTGNNSFDNSAEKPNEVPGNDGIPTARNKRSVWTVATHAFPGAHFATFPPKLIEPCILAGSREGDTVLDPFNGAGTTGLVALRHDRSYVGIELNPAYAALARQRIHDDSPLLNGAAELAA